MTIYPAIDIKGGRAVRLIQGLADRETVYAANPADMAVQFKAAGATQFGSGWAWLVLDNGTLKVTKTGNADLPLAHGQKALLTMDVWEHAYYLDYQNRRPDYITTFLDKLVNWDFVAANLAAA